ncbi:CdaR family protein [Limosilactobacillus reuteri]|uniref:CdaR family protein n=1 Tax=Limosilactobacillus reuteri TaxID=1598 RepID=UPI0013E975DD|nr:CdaR family protein [Limosilactobacillus reuteri]
MGKDTKGFFRRKWFLRIISLILALFLFMYVNGSKSGFLRQNTRNNNQSSALMSNKSVTLRMPLDVTIDNNKYIVSGYPQYVKVKVTGPSALVTTTSNTQNFKVYADLSDLTPGKHRVKLKTSGLNSELTSKIEPQYINVNIQPRKTITMKVTIRLSTRDLDNGYKLGRPHSDIQTVQVTGSRDEVNKVNRIVAFVAIPHDAKDNIARQVTLQAIDRNGQTLNVVTSPTTTNVSIPISAGSQSSSSNDSSSSSSGSEEAKSNSRATSRNDSSDSSSETSQSSSSISNEDSSSSSRNQ